MKTLNNLSHYAPISREKSSDHIQGPVAAVNRSHGPAFCAGSNWLHGAMSEISFIAVKGVIK